MIAEVSKKLGPDYGCTTLGKLRRWAGCIAVYYTIAWCVDCMRGVSVADRLRDAASGLLYIAEVIEEHSRLAKTIATRAIYVRIYSHIILLTCSLFIPARTQVIIVFHLVLYFFDSLPLTHIAFGIVCHIVYLRNIGQTWPLISLSSPTFIASCLLVLADHFLWFFYFANKSKAARRTRGTYRRGDPGPSFGDISTFFAICVWCVPLFLFLSLSANDNVLPSNGACNPCHSFFVFRILRYLYTV